MENCQSTRKQNIAGEIIHEMKIHYDILESQCHVSAYNQLHNMYLIGRKLEFLKMLMLSLSFRELCVGEYERIFYQAHLRSGSPVLRIIDLEHILQLYGLS